ncbi:ectoine/hydroxyectoine ABC transporter permease subunit EhuC [Marinicrinis sediminis]|uniref:Ectoine/hydroxyectoine ABC transporter permease subunit EhuC n=1 Tax=Marinicrinis sediminis TaxID=1652465 RepID=A0ABW5R971_9BACL
MDTISIDKYLPDILRGTWVTVEVTILSAILAFIVAFVFGLGRLSNVSIIRWISYICVEFIRGTSLLVQLFWLYYVLPIVLKQFNIDLQLDALFTGVLAIGLNYGAYGSEIVRSSIKAVPGGQREAGIALNFSPLQIMMRIIIPQALMRMIPPFGNLLIELLKGTSLVSFITLADLTYEAKNLRNFYYSESDFIFLILLVIYFVLAYSMTFAIRKLERRITAGRM